MEKSFPVLETERLKLRRLELTDAETVRLLAGAEEVAATTLLIPHPYPEGAAEEWIRHTQVEGAEGKDYTFAVTRLTDSLFLGAISLHINLAHNRAELGYWIGVPYWGQGYATEAAKRMLKFGFEELTLNRIFAGYFVNNPASRRVQEKAGMKYEGARRQDVLKRNVYLDVGFCAITRDEYIASLLFN